MFSEQNERVKVCRLAGGDALDAVIDILAGSTLQLKLMSKPEDSEFNRGELVEVSSLRSIYLGEVKSRTGEAIVIGVEHLLDRDALAAINEVWHRPGA